MLFLLFLIIDAQAMRGMSYIELFHYLFKI